jgi:sporulation-control protein spo0M
MNANQILDREFLEIRAKILEVAAALDRLDRADGDVRADPRMQLIRNAIEVLSKDDSHRAERVQLLFSREYDEAWQDHFSLTSKS